MKKLAFLAIALAFAFMATPAMANWWGNDDDCEEYCWLEFITPISANVNVADIDSNIDTVAKTGGNSAWTNVEIDDMKWGSNATINMPTLNVKSGAATAHTDQYVMANMIEPLNCNGCDSGIFVNVNVAEIDSDIDTVAKSGGNRYSLKAEIEDLCHSNAAINGGVATVASDDAWAKTENSFAVNFIGDWSAAE